MPIELTLRIEEESPRKVTVRTKGSGEATVEEAAVTEVVVKAITRELELLGRNDPHVESVLSIERTRFERMERGDGEA